MASRHLSRSLVLQTLFECDMHGGETSDPHDVLERNIKDFSYGDADIPFAEKLLDEVLQKKDEVDAVMVTAAPEWPLDKIAPVDRNVLRIGLYELLFGNRDEVPPKVALNEAIELAKAFGGETSGKFVNGVLGSVYRDIGEPGKNDIPREPAPLPHESLGGVMLVTKAGNVVYAALVKDAFNRWTLPKSKCADGELVDSAALRALTDELGVNGTLGESLGEHEYIAHEPGEGRSVRTVSYYLVPVTGKPALTALPSSGIQDVRWFSEEEIATIESYPDLAATIDAGIVAAKKI